MKPRDAQSGALPPELERGVKLAHRSPTYAFKLEDGRDLIVRREAVALKDNLSHDRKKLAAGGGDLMWWVRCGDVETMRERLDEALIAVIAQRVPADDFEANWSNITAVFRAAMVLLEMAVPKEQQGVSRVAA